MDSPPGVARSAREDDQAALDARTPLVPQREDLGLLSRTGPQRQACDSRLRIVRFVSATQGDRGTQALAEPREAVHARLLSHAHQRGGDAAQLDLIEMLARVRVADCERELRPERRGEEPHPGLVDVAGALTFTLR